MKEADSAVSKPDGVLPRVLLVDDDDGLRAGLLELLSRDHRIVMVGACASGAEALETLEHQAVDVLLLDYAMPGMSGVDTAHAVVQRFPNVRIVMLTAFEYPESLGQALLERVVGFLTKDLPAPAIVNAVLAAFAGLPVMAPAATERLVESYRQHTAESLQGQAFRATVGELDARLLPVLDGIAEGLSNRAIAQQTGLSDASVRTYASKVLAAFRCESRTQLAILAARAQYRPDRLREQRKDGRRA
ncbi:response regulator transcription factor [Actinomyces ruminicola]|uniref:response regulator n=1 Tax=Actinomyces ruminicola TaxID=332524 RepID=UPI0011CBA8E5|nr:response regulator transcription factor [Actinomyces ruminicola]